MLPPRPGSVLILLLLAGAAGMLRADSDSNSKERIAALVKQLGDDSYFKREAATKELQEFGEPALPTVREAISSKSLEVRRRAQRIARTIILNCRKSKSTGLETLLIEPGEFQMGSPKAEKARRPDEAPHSVRITRQFLLGMYEVSQADFRQVMKSNPSWFASSGGGRDMVAGKETGRFPVEQVTWYSAIEFCNRLSALDGYPPYYKLADEQRELDALKSATVTIVGGNGYRLPTEAEWEYACRAGTKEAFHFGGSATGKNGNFAPTSSTEYGTPEKWQALGRTNVGGSYESNFLGLYDMHGNVGEWCWDWYGKDYYMDSPVNDPHGPAEGKQRVLRGGSWLVSYDNCRSASRFWHTPDESKNYAGFRIARTP